MGRECETKYEDMAYSLQGIFDIHIPLIYGEGYKRALIRLQREIQHSFYSLSIFSRGGASCMVPFDRNPNFTGRESQLAHLEERLFVRGQPTKYAVTGLGGVGKTQLPAVLAASSTLTVSGWSDVWYCSRRLYKSRIYQ
jgi:hypothetical protein